MSAGKPSSEESILAVLESRSDAPVAEIAGAAGVGRSTAGKLLAQLEQAGRVRRTAGGQAGGRRLPDRWSLAAKKTPPRGRPGRGRRLRPGELDGLVLDYLERHRGDGPLTPTVVARGLERSAGAVGNCLVRLATAGRVRQTSDRPRRYRAN